MRYLLRTLETREGGSVEYRDNEFVSDVITIGRATDQDIQLTDTGVELEHARIGQRMGGKAQIKSLSVSGVSINDDVVSAGTLKIGDVIKIGDSTLEIISPPPGFDFALTLARGEGVEPEGEPGAQYVTSLEQTKLSKRKWSWVLFIVIVVLFMGLPVAGLLNEGLRDILRSTPLPSDNVWDSGPLIPAHRIPELAGNCNACHAIPFRMVNNKECLACHKDVGKHADEEAHNTPELTEARCESCHKEHNEPAAIVRTDEALCVDCHGDLKANTPAETRLRNARNFGTDHPSFRLTTLVPQNKGKDTTWKAVRLDQDGTGLVEQSNLKFSHKAHLDPKGVEAPEGQVILQCEDCHQLDGAGKLMQTIQMEQICRRCHALVFDKDDPDREVAHGDPDMVLLTLEEYYSREYLESAVGAAAVDTAPRRRLRRGRPGRRPMVRQQKEQVLQLARDKAQKVAEQIFDRSICLTCHEVTKIEDEERLAKWDVEPVRLTEKWLPKHDFDHYAHRNEECSRCHSVEDSEKSSDVLMPDIAVCRECHGGAGSQLETTCVGCHNFHIPALGVMEQ